MQLTRLAFFQPIPPGSVIRRQAGSSEDVAQTAKPPRQGRQWRGRHAANAATIIAAKRVGNRIEKTYLGAGDAARQAAAKDAATKAGRAADQAALAELQARLSGLDQAVAEVEVGVDVLTEATLLSIGFHQHRGQWRRHRNVDRT